MLCHSSWSWREEGRQKIIQMQTWNKLTTSPNGMFWQQWNAMLVMVVLLPVRRLPKKAMVGCLGRFSGTHAHSKMGPAMVSMVVGPVMILQLATGFLCAGLGFSSASSLSFGGSLLIWFYFKPEKRSQFFPRRSSLFLHQQLWKHACSTWFCIECAMSCVVAFPQKKIGLSSFNLTVCASNICRFSERQTNRLMSL